MSLYTKFNYDLSFSDLSFFLLLHLSLFMAQMAKHPAIMILHSEKIFYPEGILWKSP